MACNILKKLDINGCSFGLDGWWRLRSNGDLDPWSAGGVLQSPAPSLVSIVIENAAHHLDLRASNPADTEAVTATRRKEKAIVKRWLRQYYNLPRSSS